MSCVLIPSSAMDGVNYHDYNSGVYYPSMVPMPSSDTMSFNSSFSSQPEYVLTPYPAASNFEVIDGPAHASRSFSESFVRQPTESFNAAAGTSSTHNITLQRASPTPTKVTKYPAIPISPSQAAPRLKAKRTPTACEECRKRKQKCDGEVPCQACREQKLTCRYREVSPTKKDNTLEKLMSIVETYSKTLTTLSERLDAMSCTLRQIEQRLTRCWRCGSAVELSNGNCEACGHVSHVLPAVG